MKNEEEMQRLREEYRQLLRTEATEEELTAREDEIIKLKTELEEDIVKLNENYGFSWWYSHGG